MAAAPILLVEDDPSLAEALSFILEQAGFQVVVAGDGEAALRQLHRRAFAAIVLDIMLPGIDGLEVLRTVRADERLATLPVIVLSAKGQANDRLTAKAIGATAFITKPFSNDEIIACVSEFAGV